MPADSSDPVDDQPHRSTQPAARPIRWPSIKRRGGHGSRSPPWCCSAARLGDLWKGIGCSLHYDDRISVVNNPSILHVWPLFGDQDAPGPLRPPRNLSTAGRPLVNLSLALNYHFGWLNPAHYHAFNLGVHVPSALLVWIHCAACFGCRDLLRVWNRGRRGCAVPLALVCRSPAANRRRGVRHARHRVDDGILLSRHLVRQSEVLDDYRRRTEPVLRVFLVGLPAGNGLQRGNGHLAGGRALYERTFLRGSFGEALRVPGRFISVFCRPGACCWR